ncbi:hypothetical protein OXX69_005505 [Metschnikowia pulcherrima]
MLGPEEIEQAIIAFESASGKQLSPEELSRFKVNLVSMNGDPGASLTKLAETLTEIAEGEEIEDVTQHDYVAFENIVNDLLEQKLKDNTALSDVTSHKWIESLESIFDRFEHSQAILTTMNYVKADLKNKKVHWDRFTFKDSRNIIHAASILDRKIVNYLTLKNLLGPLNFRNTVEVREFWEKANALAKLSRTSPFAEYMKETLDFFSYFPSNTYTGVVDAYYHHMQKKYDKVFIRCMDSIGFVPTLALTCFANTKMTQPLWKGIDDWLSLWREIAPSEPSKLEGGVFSTSFLESSREFQRGVTDFEEQTKTDMDNRKRRQPEPTIYLPNNKRVKAHEIGNIFTNQVTHGVPTLTPPNSIPTGKAPTGSHGRPTVDSQQKR